MTGKPIKSVKHRAVVLKRDGALAKVYYLDYGNSESLSLGSIFSMPPNQLATQMLSIRCRCLRMTVMMLRINDNASKDVFDTMT